jgi:hypothetical protein
MRKAANHFSFCSTDVTVQLNGLRLSVGSTDVALPPKEARELAVNLLEAAGIAEGLGVQVEAWKRHPMQYLHFEARQAGRKSTRQTAGKKKPAKTAHVHCWIKDQSVINALYIAIGWIRRKRWETHRLLEQRDATRQEFEGTEFSQYCKQAYMDDEVFLFEIFVRR